MQHKFTLAAFFCLTGERSERGSASFAARYTSPGKYTVFLSIFLTKPVDGDYRSAFAAIYDRFPSGRGIK